MRRAGDCLKYLKRRWNRKERRGNKDFKKGGKLVQRVSVLKRGGGLEPPYKLCFSVGVLLGICCIYLNTLS